MSWRSAPELLELERRIDRLTRIRNEIAFWGVLLCVALLAGGMYYNLALNTVCLVTAPILLVAFLVVHGKLSKLRGYW